MFTNNDFRVRLINADEVADFVRRHGEFAAVCYNTPTKYAKNVGKTVLEDGHFSGSRADFFKFEIELVPRYTVDQAVRHEEGIVKNVQSQRYVDMENFSLYMTDLVANDEYLRGEFEAHRKCTQDRYVRMKAYLEQEYGLTGEKANDNVRGILPIGSESKFNYGLNLEGMINFCHVRLCKRADEPVRRLANLMVKEVLKVAPIYKEQLVPKCVYSLYCNESHGCKKADGTRLYPTRKELEQELKELRKMKGKTVINVDGVTITDKVANEVTHIGYTGEITVNPIR